MIQCIPVRADIIHMVASKIFAELSEKVDGSDRILRDDFQTLFSLSRETKHDMRYLHHEHLNNLAFTWFIVGWK